jgi:hypothetical protein
LEKNDLALRVLIGGNEIMLEDITFDLPSGDDAAYFVMRALPELRPYPLLAQLFPQV